MMTMTKSQIAAMLVVVVIGLFVGYAIGSATSSRGSASSSNSVCMLYREVDKASSCTPLKSSIGSNATDTAIVYTGDGGTKWCMTALDAKPLACTTIHPSMAEQEAELQAAKAKAATPQAPAPTPAAPTPTPTPTSTQVPTDAPLGPPFAPRP